MPYQYCNIEPRSGPILKAYDASANNAGPQLLVNESLIGFTEVVALRNFLSNWIASHRVKEDKE